MKESIWPVVDAHSSQIKLVQCQIGLIVNSIQKIKAQEKEMEFSVRLFGS